jgi:hypothetical protein
LIPDAVLPTFRKKIVKISSSKIVGNTKNFPDQTVKKIERKKGQFNTASQ